MDVAARRQGTLDAAAWCGGEGGGGGRGGGGGWRDATNIKSDNPHLTGREKRKKKSKKNMRF